MTDTPEARRRTGYTRWLTSFLLSVVAAMAVVLGAVELLQRHK